MDEEARPAGIPYAERARLRLFRTGIASVRTFLGVATEEYELGEIEKAKRSRARAEREYAELVVRVVEPQFRSCVMPSDLADIETALKRLRKDLDGIAALNRIRED